MYFWIVGDKKDLIEYGLSYLHARKIQFIQENLVCFETDYSHKLATCAVLIKRWIVVEKSEIIKMINTEIIGIAHQWLGKLFKDEILCVKRFKVVKLIHTDQEIKNNGHN